jgi:hypothetical protein
VGVPRGRLGRAGRVFWEVNGTLHYGYLIY